LYPSREIIEHRQGYLFDWTKESAKSMDCNYIIPTFKSISEFREICCGKTFDIQTFDSQYNIIGWVKDFKFSSGLVSHTA
jgi:hypothetical protein